MQPSACGGQLLPQKGLFNCKTYQDMFQIIYDSESF